MSFVLIATLAVCLAGALGGAANALISNNGFFLPRQISSNQMTLVQPGFLGNIFVGIVAALISWGLYSPFGSVELFQPLPTSVSFTIASFVGAMLVGVGGARWLSNEVDKRLLRAAAVAAANVPASPALAQQMVVSPPAKAFEIVQQMQSAAQPVQ